MTRETIEIANDLLGKIERLQTVIGVLSSSILLGQEQLDAVGQCILDDIRPTDRIKIKQIIKAYIDEYESKLEAL